MTIPDYQSLMLHVLKSAAYGEVKISDVVDQLADELELTEDERAELLPSGRQTIFSNRVHWAKTYLTKAGLLETTRRAHFVISDRGRNLLSENPTRVDNECLGQYPEFVEFRARRKSDDEPHERATPDLTSDNEDRTPDEIIRIAHKELSQTLRDELLERILDASPAFFEQLVVNLLIEMGYGGSIEEAGRKLGRSGDGGVDGVIDQDALGLDRVYVQAKRYSPGNTVGSAAIRDFFGSLDRFKAAKGIIITTSSFTRDASATGEQLSKRIVLVDGVQLAGLMIRYNVGCRIHETLHLKKIDEDYFDG